MQAGCQIFCCVFCKDPATLSLKDFHGFRTHMETVHNIFYQFDLLLACNFLDKDDQAMVVEKAKVKWSSKSLETKESSEAKNVKIFQE